MANLGYANVSVKPKKIKRGNHKYLTNIGRHLLREAIKAYKLANPEATKDNVVLIDMEEDTLAKSLNSFLKKHKIKTRNSETVQAYQLVFSIPKELKSNPEIIKKFQEEVLNYLNTDPKFAGNCLLAVYHHDEVQPHIQAVMVPRTHDNTLNFKRFLGGLNGSAKLHHLHDDFHDAVGKKLGLKRGDGTHTKNLNHKQYMKAVDELEKPIHQVDQVEPAADSWNPWKTIEKLKEENEKLRQTNEKLSSNSRKVVYLETQNIEQKKELKKLIRDKNTLERNNMKMAEEQLEKLRQIDCKDVLNALGFHYKMEGTSARYKDTEKNINLVISADNKFTDNKSMKQGGGAIDLLVKVFNYKFTEAKEFLANSFGFDRTVKVISANPEHIQKTITESVKKDLLEPPAPKPNNLPRVKKYLTETRKISPQIVNTLINHGLLYADRNNNCVFTNEDNSYAFLRGTYQAEGKFPFVGTRGKMDFIKYNFNPSKTNEIYLFESAIDALSFKDLNPDKDGLYVVLNGNALVKKAHMLELNKFDKVNCCFDNDEAGKKFCDMIKEQTTAQVEIYKPKFKDFNEDLINGKSKPSSDPEFRDPKITE